MNILEIEWRHLDKDGRTCLRCSDTLQSLQQVVTQLAAECAPHGVHIAYRETKLPPEQLSESNLILFNGVPLESALPGASAAPPAKIRARPRSSSLPAHRPRRTCG